jgi:hypothetical protein
VHSGASGSRNLIAVGGHKKHILTTNIPTFLARYRR